MNYSLNKKFSRHRDLEYHGSSIEIRTQIFFHNKASQRKRRNHIQKIKNSKDCWVDEVEDIVGVAIDYFDNLFHASTCDQIDECLSVVTHRVTLDMQQIMSSDFISDEIKATLF